MPRRPTFLTARWLDHWGPAYEALPADRQENCDQAAMWLIKRQDLPGLRIKPILPDKYYYEARISGGQRIIFHLEGGTIYFVDVVGHDDIARYGRRPRERP